MQFSVFFFKYSKVSLSFLIFWHWFTQLNCHVHLTHMSPHIETDIAQVLLSIKSRSTIFLASETVVLQSINVALCSSIGLGDHGCASSQTRHQLSDGPALQATSRSRKTGLISQQQWPRGDQTMGMNRPACVFTDPEHNREMSFNKHLGCCIPNCLPA